MSTNRLILSEYCKKYGISSSTVRRRIKSGELIASLIDGRYWIDDDLEEMRSQPNQVSLRAKNQTNYQGLRESQVKANHSNSTFKLQPNQFLEELKKAYTQVLQEKEEQLIMCREEIADLQTLVRVLESENERLSKLMGLDARINHPPEFIPEGRFY